MQNYLEFEKEKIRVQKHMSKVRITVNIFFHKKSNWRNVQTSMFYASPIIFSTPERKLTRHTKIETKTNRISKKDHKYN